MKSTAQKTTSTEREIYLRVLKIRPLHALLKDVSIKRQSELIRFRTCCADPRASK